MRVTILLFALCAILTSGCAQSPVDTDYHATMLLLPEGEPDAGREAFVSLGCMACHAVAWDEDLPNAGAAVMGPELGLDVSKLGPGGLATSVVAPSHKVSEKYRKMAQGEVSPMRDYTREMTIRQLADIVAYLQRQGLETQTRTGLGTPTD